MDFAIWAYPWDLIDEGIEPAVNRLREMGIDEISLATNYHSAQTFLPHNPERRTFFTQASSYFHPGDDYGTLRPFPSDTMGDADWVEQIAIAVKDTTLSLNSWTIGCHNSRLGMRHPEVTLTNAFGDSLVFGLCPSNPEVQQYLRVLVADINARADLERIELETFDYFYGTGFGWHHAKFHTQLGTLGKFLYGLCFCDHCRKNAAKDGVNVSRVQAIVRETIDGIVAGNVPHDTDIAAWIYAHPPLAAYLEIRSKTLASLYSDLADAAGSSDLGYYVGLLDVGRTWMHGADLHALADDLDYYLVAAYESSRAAAVDCLAEANTLTPEIPLHAGIHPGHPDVHDAATLKEIMMGLTEFGVPRISFYNYGLLPEQNLDWIEDGIQAIT